MSAKAPADIQASLRFYAFDCLVINGENIMAKPLEKRFGVSVSSAILPQPIPERSWLMDSASEHG